MEWWSAVALVDEILSSFGACNSGDRLRDSLESFADRVRQNELGDHPDSMAIFAGQSPRRWHTLLLAALANGAEALALALLDVGADPGARHVRQCPPTRRVDYSRTPLAAACAGAPGVVPALLRAGADPNLGEAARPPLHIAVQHGHVGAVRALLAAGADPLALDGLGRTAAVRDLTPLDPACLEEIRAAAAPLLAARKGASVRTRSQRGKGERDGLRVLLKQALAEDGLYLMLFRKGSASELASALASTLGTDADGRAHERWISETEYRYYGVVEMKGQPWAIALMEAGKRIDKERTLMLAKELSRSAEVVVLFGDQVHAFDDGDGRETITRFRGVDEGVRWFAEQGIVVPLMGFSPDGFSVGVDVYGVKKADIADAWIVWDRG